MPKSSVAWIGGSGGRQLCLSFLRSSGAVLQSEYSVYRVHAAATNHTQHATYAAICNAQHATVTYAAIYTHTCDEQAAESPRGCATGRLS